MEVHRVGGALVVVDDDDVAVVVVVVVVVVDYDDDDSVAERGFLLGLDFLELGLLGFLESISQTIYGECPKNRDRFTNKNKSFVL